MGMSVTTPATTEPKRRRFSKNFVLGVSWEWGYVRNRKSVRACMCVCDCVYVCPLLLYSFPRIHTRQTKHVQSKTYIHLPQRRAKILAIVRMDEEEEGGGRESGGAGTVDILTAKIGMVTRARAVESHGVVGVDHEAEV